MVGGWKTAARAAILPSPLQAEARSSRPTGVCCTVAPVSQRRSLRAQGDTTATSPASPAAALTIGIALLAWMAGWVTGNLVASAVLGLAGNAHQAAVDRPVWLNASMAVALWVPQLAALVVVSRAFASGHPARDFSFRFAPRDLLGIPIGVVSQLALLPLIYWPLQKAWPDTFADKQLEQNARDLYDRAHGGWVVALIMMVVIGAPVVEELVYRGLLQGAARRRLGLVWSVLVVAAFFALIHFRPVEYPGLFAFGLVLGCCAALTNRLGIGIVSHMAFNATALVLVAR